MTQGSTSANDAVTPCLLCNQPAKGGYCTWCSNPIPPDKSHYHDLNFPGAKLCADCYGRQHQAAAPTPRKPAPQKPTFAADAFSVPTDGRRSY